MILVKKYVQGIFFRSFFAKLLLVVVKSIFFCTKKLAVISPSCLQARIKAYDTARPTASAVATVNIFVIRNPNSPQFQLPSYSTTINENQAIGQFILNVTAVDADVQVSFNVKLEIFQPICVRNFLLVVKHRNIFKGSLCVYAYFFEISMSERGRGLYNLMFLLNIGCFTGHHFLFYHQPAVFSLQHK